MPVLPGGFVGVDVCFAQQDVYYLTSGDTSFPLQHYWSLAVEEQFYVVWPLLVGLVVVLVRRARGGAASPALTRRVLTVVLSESAATPRTCATCAPTATQRSRADVTPAALATLTASLSQ